MARILLARLTINALTGLPKDAVEFGFTYQSDGTRTPDLDSDAAALQLANFLELINAPGVRPVGAYLSPLVNTGVGGSAVAVYDITGKLDGTPHGPPIKVLPALSSLRGAFALPAVGLPPQLCAVLSYHGTMTGLPAPVTGPIPTPDRAVDMGAPASHTGVTRPAERHRGRLFFGPLGDPGLVSSGDGATVSDQLRLALCKAAARMVIESAAAAVPWVVWSRASAAVYPVVGGWCENRFGTQRRRSEKATVRQLWP